VPKRRRATSLERPGMPIASREEFVRIDSALMLGSRPNESNPALQTLGIRLYSVRVLERTLWGWQRRNAAGDLLACNGHFFPDYVDCLCDSLRF
jgi:hypothetical protein